MRSIAILLAVALTGCATLSTSTQRVRVITDPPGASVAVLEDSGTKALGPSPVEYHREYQSYHCSPWIWTLPFGMAVVGGGAGVGISYASTVRNDRLDAAEQLGTLIGVAAFVLGIAIAGECFFKDEVVPEHKDVRVLLEASKDGYKSALAPLMVPSKVEELKLTLPKLADPAPEEK
jgi:hypothetical protein